MKSLSIAWLVSALLISQADAQVYYNYPQWDRLNDLARATYIAGAYDSLISIATPDTAAAARHYSKCVVSHQLSTATRQKRPRIRGHASRLAKGTGARRAYQLSR
jgi:hypothetical protein